MRTQMTLMNTMDNVKTFVSKNLVNEYSNTDKVMNFDITNFS